MMKSSQNLSSADAEAPNTPAARTDARREHKPEEMLNNRSTARNGESTQGPRRKNSDLYGMRHKSSPLRNRLRWYLSICLLCTLLGCNGKPAAPKNESGGANPPSLEPKVIIDRYRGLDTSRNSTARMKVTIQESDGSAREFRLTMYRKREPDGTQLLLIEFTAPKEERDRSSLISISPQGEIEATRYAQSTDGFVSARGATSEESLFGMSLQELAEGQPEKYDFTLLGEDIFNSSPVYRLEGKLREGEESKFSRVVLLISKDTFAALVAEFYDRNTLVRRITVDRLEQIR